MAFMTLKGFQYRAHKWCLNCLGELYVNNKIERNYRFIEEALELVQSLGMTKEETLKLVDYVFNRSVGNTANEVGGVMLTLAVLATINDLDIQECMETELLRIEDPVVMEKVREKQAYKNTVLGVTNVR